MKKKKNGWKLAFFILLILIVLFFIWALSDDEETDTTGYTDTTVSETNTTPINATPVSGSKEEILASLKMESLVRNKESRLKGDGTDTATILLYMNGSDLESDDGSATTDLLEMVHGMQPGNVTLLVQTMNTKRWSNDFNISSKKTQRFELTESGLNLVDNSLGQLSCLESSTLEDFIRWGTTNYPADRYILLFWDHGGGPIYGFGYDDITESEDMLSTDEIQLALKNAGTYFDFIGMDCCLMSSMELCCSLYDFCDYCILSEDFESGYGWYYTDWLSAFCSNSSMPTEELGKHIIDSMVDYNRKNGEDAILTMVDESYMKVLYTNWVNFAYANESSLLGTNYSREMKPKAGGRVHPVLQKKGLFDFLFGEDYEMSDYYITDIMAVAQNIDSEESKALASSVSKALCYSNCCNGSCSLTGLSVTLPYGDSDFYDELKRVFSNCGFDANYIAWLQNFVSNSVYDSYYDYDDWDDSWDGWDEYEDDYDWDDWCSDCFFDDWDDWDTGDYCDDCCDDCYYYNDEDDCYCDDYFDWGWSDDDFWYWFFDEDYDDTW